MRAVVIVLDSVGVGHAPDAADCGDEGANTLGHLLDYDPQLPKKLPTLWSMGMGHILHHNPVRHPRSSFGRMTEISKGKDSTTGHWELAGASLAQPLGLYEKFPRELIAAIEAKANVRFIGNFPASGTVILDQLGEEHLYTGHPILYTSADSVMQIAAHEQIIPLPRLYEICQIARTCADDYRIGRIIARPFIGQPGNFKRTAARHDFSMSPPPTVLDRISDSGIPVHAIGKINDLFAGRGITRAYTTNSNAEGMKITADLWKQLRHGLLLTNLVDFDTLFGHRRDPQGYIAALIAFDRWLEDFLEQITPRDLLILTADHGNDPTFKGTDHTREQVPLLMHHLGRTDDLGTRATFSDVAASLCDFFSLPSWPIGTSFLHHPTAALDESASQCRL